MQSPGAAAIRCAAKSLTPQSALDAERLSVCNVERAAGASDEDTACVLAVEPLERYTVGHAQRSAQQHEQLVRVVAELPVRGYLENAFVYDDLSLVRRVAGKHDRARAGLCEDRALIRIGQVVGDVSVDHQASTSLVVDLHFGGRRRRPVACYRTTRNRVVSVTRHKQRAGIERQRRVFRQRKRTARARVDLERLDRRGLIQRRIARNGDMPAVIK